MIRGSSVRGWGRAALVAAVVVAAAGPARADESSDATRRIATLAPEGSAWMKLLNKAAQQVAVRTERRVTYKFYPGASQGDERDVVRKMKLRQLDGAALTSVGLALIYPGIRVMELPFLFESVEEVDYVRAKTWSYFKNKFHEKGFELLTPGDVGWTYLFSTKPLATRDDLGTVRMWAWQDDPIVRAMYRRLEINGVPMGVPDVLPALKTDRIDGCYGAPLAAVALQWYTELEYATSMPVAYSVGALVIRTEVWERSTEADRAAQLAIAKATGERLVARVRKDNERAMKAMVKSGIEIIATPPGLAKEFEAVSKEIWRELVGKVYTQAELDMVLRYRDEYRSQQARSRR